MGIRGKKETKKSLRDVQRLGSDFVMTEGEGILRVRNKTILCEGIIKIWDIKEKKKRRIQKNKREG